MSVSLIRTPEIIFQPSLIGLDQMGLAEVLHTILSRMNPEKSQEIVRHVHLAGI
jgi:actin-related protein 5